MSLSERSRCRLSITAVLLALLALCAKTTRTLSDHTANKGYAISTFINAKWRQTPLHLEIAEYLADENPGLYWDFVQKVNELETPISEYDAESKRYLASLNVARAQLNQLQLPLLKLVVSMHSLTPLIQTHFQLAAQVLANGDCNANNFAQVGMQLVCSVEELKLALGEKSKSYNAALETYSFDHIYPGSENNTRTVVLYGDIGSRDFRLYHKLLAKEALSNNVRYIARHYIRKLSPRKVRLSGYGVELHLKSTEYKSQDESTKPAEEKLSENEEESAEDLSAVEGFNFKVLKQRFPVLSTSLQQFKQHLLQGNEEIAKLKAWEFQDLGLQAAAAVMGAQGEEALQVLQFTVDNFPTNARALLSHKVSEELRNEVKYNTDAFSRSLNIVPPDGALFVNGLFFDADTMDLSSLMETLRTELRVVESLYENKVRGSAASALLAMDLSTSTNREFAIDIRDTAILWVNDIENDQQYRRWPSSVMDLLRPTFPGMLRNIRKNVFNLVLVVNPLERQGRNLIKLVESFVIHNAPVRLGLVFDSRPISTQATNDFHAVVCAYNYVNQKQGSRAALSFLTDVYAQMNKDDRVQKQHVRNQLKKAFDNLSNKAVDEILEEDSDYDYGKQLAEEFIDRLGFVDTTPQALLNGVPMQQSLLMSDSDFEEAIFSEIIRQTGVLQKAVYKGELTDNDSALDYLMNQPHVMPHLNQRILNTDGARYIDLSGSAHQDLSNVRRLETLSNRDMTATLMANLKYFTTKLATEKIHNSNLHFLTLWIFTDLSEAKSRKLLENALLYLKTSSSMRVAFIPNAEGATLNDKTNLNRLVWAALQTLPAKEATERVLKWLQVTESTNAKLDVPKELHDVLDSTDLHIKMLRVYAQRVLGLKKSESLLIANGKIFGPLTKNELFTLEDFGLLDRFINIQYGDKIRKVLLQADADHDDEVQFNSDTLLKLYAILIPRPSKTRFKLPDDVKNEHSVVKLLPKHVDLPHFELYAVIDPASRSAQKLTPMLVLLRNTLNCRMSIYLTPVGKHSDMPVKNFYRYVLEQEVQFQPNGELADGPMAKFVGIPTNLLLTQNLQVPENWLVEVVRSVYDLDNIKLSEIGGPVHSEYELEYLLLEGHCFDAAHGTPPRGLQITLGTKEQPVLVDTIVMANLGYFQLKANPGIWELRLRDGKSTDIYEISQAEGQNTLHRNQTINVVLSSLRSHVIKLRVSKKDGMQGKDLLSDDDDQAHASGIWNSLANTFSGGSSENSNGLTSEDNDTINIFSVASGHLYERLLRIMMISLLKHTKSPVKFWFLKNYLSPQFIDFLPHMAKEYGFAYELVQYKWPRWLHQQTEKQRTIWGYKILFLDVLFPLNVRKIIFVDADAIVRADLQELYDMDLGGAPYAYTPFCDSRKEMDGFRFWKQGYWHSHLMGRRYHISALYVVDLKRFRRIAAGDRLRGQYQALSQDANSLANLDQDLPNNMLHQVAIKSLPDEWLWCQTWCSDSSLKYAKVIDLCNNPQTKEAKLTAAQRIVPEWKDYDLEIKQLMARVEDRENTEHDAHLNEAVADAAVEAITDKYTDRGTHSTPHSEL